MKQFFHGWRRKAGVVTLVMALATFVASVRSHFCRDVLIVGTDQNNWGFALRSEVGVLIWSRYRTPQDQIDFFDPGWHRFRIDPTTYTTVLWEFGEGPRYQLFGIGGGELRNIRLPGDRLSFVQVPYWCFILLLTLISGYLVLWKPGKRA